MTPTQKDKFPHIIETPSVSVANEAMSTGLYTQPKVFQIKENIVYVILKKMKGVK